MASGKNDGTFHLFSASDKLNNENRTGPTIDITKRRIPMKRLFALFLVLSLVLLSAAWAHADEKVVMPISPETEINTSWGTYSFSIADPSSILRTGSVKLSLYAQDMYRLSDIDKLSVGSSIQVAGSVYKVAKVSTYKDGSVAIDGGENSVPIVFHPSGEVYVATRNDAALGSYIGDYKLMLPLPDSFCFYWMHSNGSVNYYDGDSFADLLGKGSLSQLDRSCAVLSFSGGQPRSIVYADYTVSVPDEIIATAAASRNSNPVPPAGPVYSASGVSSFTVEPIRWEGHSLGKCGLPSGYTMYTEVHCGDAYTCMGAPIRINVEAVSGSCKMGYYASEQYIERVRSSMYRQKDGTLDGQLHIFMMHYMNASQFCDWLASRVVEGAAFWKNEDSSFLDNSIAAQLAEYRNEVEPGLKKYKIKTNWYDVTAAHRVYTYNYNGTTFALCILAKVRGYQTVAGPDTMTTWDVPEYYYLACPLSDYDRIHGSDFQAFISNTTFSDTFKNLQEQLSNQIQIEIEQGWARDIAFSNAYTQAMNALVSQSVNSYLSSSSYSASDRFSDYIFDRNEYTTSDGYTCTISTAYDYVWEDNGTVFYSNSSFDMPSGATLLNPR